MSAQVATAILREGDAPIGAPPGITVTSISGVAANEVGGVFASLRLTNWNDGIWGDATGLNGVMLREVQIGISGYDQTAFGADFGGSDTGQLGYGPTCIDLSTFAQGLDSIWLDSTPLAVENQAIPTLPGKKYRFVSQPGITGNGIPYWLGGITDIATGVEEGQALFMGSGATVVLKPGDPAPPPLTSVLALAAGDRDARFSRNGAHYINGTPTTDPGTSNSHIIIDGAIPLDAGGNRMSEGQPVSAAAGGLPGETWSNWGSLGVNDAGDWMVGGDTSAATTMDNFIAKNGVIIAREGSVLGGLTLTGGVLAADMNEAGGVVHMWNTPGNIQALYYNSTLLLKKGDLVDLDGDGVVEPTHILHSMLGGAGLVIGNTHVFQVGYVNIGGTIFDCVFAIRIPTTATSFCSGDGSGTACPCANTGLAGHGCANFNFASGARLSSAGYAGASATTDSLTLMATNIPGPGLFFQGTSQQVGGAGLSFGDGLFCAGGAILRFGVVFPTGDSATYPGGLTPSPVHLAGATASGDVRHYQCWYRDSATFCTPATNNLTQGLTILWGP
ncbi:MAG: hypothetical protein JNL28_13725 [Planctomycetes bacterium]|nr:hypothetical protein [Planctomycetota bacterium]